MGRVWLARDEMLDRDVAVKEVAPPTNLSPEEAKQLRVLIDREARAAARINHPNVVKIFDVLQTAEWPWLIMEYVPSSSLQRVVQFEGPLAPADVAKIGLAVLEGLTAAHDAGVLHRDVKPDNVLLAEDGRVMLSDFGLASLDTDGTGTRTGTLGTPQYVAPERARRGISSREADLWSLGATLYAAVEGRSPYQRETVLETLSALAVDPPDPMRLAGPLEPVIAGLLQRDPVLRTHPDHLAEQLRTVANGGQVSMPATVQAAVPASAPAPAPVLPARERLGAQKTPPANDAAPVPPDRKRTAALIGAGAIVATVVIGLILAETLRDSKEPVVSGPSNLGPLVCETQPSQTSQLPGGLPGPEGEPVPVDMVWYNDGAWGIAVPAGWTYWRVGGTTCFRDPNGNRVMTVAPSSVAAETLPGYHMISQVRMNMRGPGTRWEFTFAKAEGKRHAVAWLSPVHTVVWVTDDDDFMASLHFYDDAARLFDPLGPHGPGGGPGPGGPEPQPKPSGSPGGGL
jgi:serine/threonine protein kinase